MVYDRWPSRWWDRSSYLTHDWWLTTDRSACASHLRENPRDTDLSRRTRIRYSAESRTMEVEKKIDKEMTDVGIDVVSRFSKRSIPLKSLGKFGFVEGCIVHVRWELSSSRRVRTNGDGALCKHNFCLVIIRAEADRGYCSVGFRETIRYWACEPTRFEITFGSMWVCG